MIKNKESDKVPKGHNRSPYWTKIRREFLKKFPKCELCGSKTKLEVHHIKPFHIYPYMELDENNLITLCENKKDGVNCHLLYGHLGSYKSFNVNVRSDVKNWAEKIKRRP